MQDTENMNKKEENGRIYEVGFLLIPTIDQANLPEVFNKLKDLVLSFKGEIISDEMPKMITLAYQMQKTISNVRNKFNNAYFGWVKFVMDAEKVLELKKALDLDPHFIRFLMLKTVRENTVASKRYIRGDMPSGRMSTIKRTEDEVQVPINKEEVDKEIDAMIAA